MPSFVKKNLINIYLVFLKRMILLTLKIFFGTILVVIKPEFSIQSL